jgi:hypothetical protein
MLRKNLLALICMGCMLFLAGMLLGLWTSDWLEIDRCLDQGGRWDYHTQVCVLK